MGLRVWALQSPCRDITLDNVQLSGGQAAAAVAAAAGATVEEGLGAFKMKCMNAHGHTEGKVKPSSCLLE
jgi:hypothetical protein